MEPRHGLILDPEEALRRPLLRDLVLEVPDAVAVSELLVGRPALGQDPAFEPSHREKQVGVVLRVDGNEARVPFDGGHRPGLVKNDELENVTLEKSKSQQKPVKQ